ncbi:MAG: ribosome biogenesis GTPase Der [Sphingomonadales bacterium]|nr:ribosome biogenesis GTPase Der [Sphingomonadales bacterium]
MPVTLVILGRPNVGKSTLFNRLAGKRLAIVDDTPGVTRDRRMAEGSLGDLNFHIVDTAGLEEGDAESMFGRMRFQTEAAIDEADIAVMVIDSRAGVTPLDEHFASWLRRKKKPVILLANKCEGGGGDSGYYEAYSLGLGEPIAVSAEHGEGLAGFYAELLRVSEEYNISFEDEEVEDPNKEEVGTALEYDLVEGDLAYEFDDEDVDDSLIQIAIVGRPNAGKSTLINYLLGEERMITGPEAGLTRDSIGVDWEYEGRTIRLVDTAGLRKKSRITDKLERLSAADSLRAVQYAQVVVLMIDAEQGIEKQDLKIASHVVEEGRSLVIALNKWDVVDDRLGRQRQVLDVLTKSLPQLKGVQVLHFSALTGQGTQKLLPTVLDVYEIWNSRVPTNSLNRWLEAVIERHPPPMVNGRPIKIRFAAQVKTRPPTFLLFVNRTDDMPKSYIRYLENDLRKTYDIPGIPLRIVMRKGKNPYESRRKKKR